MSKVRITLDQNCTAKPSFFTPANSDAVIDGLNAGASTGKQFSARLIPGADTGSSAGPMVLFNAQNSLYFPAAGRTYLVILQWYPESGSFLPFCLAQKPTPSRPSNWVREDSYTRQNSIAWEVYIPSETIYGNLTMTASAVAIGNWNNPNNLTPYCYWAAPILIT